MTKTKRNVTLILSTVLLLGSFAAVSGCGREKEVIPDMYWEAEKWEIEVHPGYFGSTRSWELHEIPRTPIENHIPEDEIEYVKEPISYASWVDFQHVLITYPYYEMAKDEWRYFPEFKCFYYNSKGERIESDYYARIIKSYCYRGNETDFEKKKNDTGLDSWRDWYVMAMDKDTLYRVKIEIYDSVESYRKKYDKTFVGYDRNFDLSVHVKEDFTTYIIVKGIGEEEK